MRLCEILSSERIFLDERGDVVRGKAEALRELARMLSPAVGVEPKVVESLLSERERLQSTGIGDGVAIPHTAVDAATQQVAALLLCPQGVEFEAIDGQGVTIIFGVLGPKRSTGEHLKTLARISRLLRNPDTRKKLLESRSALDAFGLIQAQDSALG